MDVWIVPNAMGWWRLSNLPYGVSLPGDGVRCSTIVEGGMNNVRTGEITIQAKSGL